MGTLAGHILPGFLLISIGAWHLLRCIWSYSSSSSRSPREFHARIWHPIAIFRGRLKHLELYTLLLLFPAFIIYQLSVSLDSKSLMSVGAPALGVLDLQFAAMLLAFWLVTLIILLSETTLMLPLPPHAPFLLTGVAFGIEWMVLSSQQVHQLGLEGKCDSILANLALACALFCGFLAWKPNAFLGDLLLCESLVLQGSWLVQSGVILYVKRFIPQGCSKLLDLPQGIDGSVRCELEESRARAFALMDLLFICHLLVVMVLTSLVYCGVVRVVSRKRAPGYELVDVHVEGENGGGGSSMQMTKPITKQAQF